MHDLGLRAELGSFRKMKTPAQLLGITMEAHSAAIPLSTTAADQPEMKKARSTKTPISFILLIISLSIFFIITILSLYKLPPLSQPNNHSSYSSSTQQTHTAIGPFGKMMIDLLPLDLPFTLFLPSESAFTQVLKLKVNESLADKQLNDTIAVLSRVLGFSVVARGIRSGDVDEKEMDFESLSGFRLGVWKEDGRLVVNGVRAGREELSVGEVLVYVMNGVVMDAEFEQSFQEEDDDDDE